ncbi:Putative ribonuclease H protein At1g65750, partial [Linum perenne]
INLSVCSITRSKHRGALAGLNLAWEYDFRQILLQMDSATAITLFGESKTFIHKHSLEVIQFIEFMARDWVVRVKHVPREANQAVDYLPSPPWGSTSFPLPIVI